MRTATLVCLVLLGLAASSRADDIYVSTSGSDVSGDGSPGNPLGTIQGAYGLAAMTGDRIILADGIYSGIGNIGVDTLGKDADLLGTSRENTIIDCADLEGPILVIYTGSPDVSTMTLRNCYSSTASGAILVSGITTVASFSNMTISNCTSALVGGAFQIALANASFTDVLLVSAGALNGGGMYVTSSRSIILDTVTIQDAWAQTGAAVLSYASVVTITNSNISNNAATLAGILSFTLSTVYVYSTEFAYNTGGADGVAMYVTQSQTTVDGCNFLYNNAGGAAGAAICLTNSDMTNGVPDKISNSNFIGNVMGDRGTLYVKNNGTAVVTNCTFIGNVAPEGAGATASTNGTLTLINCYFSQNVATTIISNPTLTTVAALGGGAVASAKSGASVVVNSCVFVNNSAQFGGAIFVGTAGSLVIQGSTVIANNTAWYMGGGVYVQDKTSVLTISNTYNITIANNTAVYGGGFASGLVGTLKLKNVVLTGNTATTQGSGGFVSGSLSMTNTYFINNRAGVLNGGALFYQTVTAAVLCPTCGLVGNVDNANSASPVAGSTITSAPAKLYVSAKSANLNWTASGLGTVAKPYVVVQPLYPGASVSYNLAVQDELGNTLNSIDSNYKIVAAITPLNKGAVLGFAPPVLSQGLASVAVTFVGNLATNFTLSLQLTDLSGTPVATVGTLTTNFATSPTCGPDQLERSSVISAGISYPVCVAAELSLISDAAFIAVETVTAVCMVATAVLFAILHRHRAHRALKASSPKLIMTMVAATFPIYVAVLLMGIDGGSDDNTLTSLSMTATRLCRTNPWLLGLGFDFVYGAMLARTWRIHKIFNNRRRRRLQLTDTALFQAIALFALHDVILNAIWVGADPLNLQLSELSSSSTLITVTTECRSDSFGTYLGVYLGFKAAALLYGVYLAIQCRNVSDQFNESKQLGFAIYNLAFTACIILPIVFSIDASATAIYLIATLGILFAVVSTVTILCLPKLLLIWAITAGSDTGTSGRAKTSQINVEDATDEQWARLGDYLTKLSAAVTRHSAREFNELYEAMAAIVDHLSGGSSFSSKQANSFVPRTETKEVKDTETHRDKDMELSFNN